MTAFIIVAIIAVVIAAVSMDTSWNNVLSSERNNVVFQDKFKEYGAFMLRQGHGKTMAIALGTTIFITAAGFTAPLIFGKKLEEKVEIPADKILEMLTPPTLQVTVHLWSR